MRCIQFFLRRICIDFVEGRFKSQSSRRIDEIHKVMICWRKRLLTALFQKRKKTNEEIALDMREQLEVQLNEWSLKSKEEIVSQRLERFNQY